MTRTTDIESLRRHLIDERRRAVEAAAAGGMLPPANMLAYLADLDTAALAVEAVLDERARRAAAVME